MINRPVLVLNQTYEPLNICRVRRAIVLIYQGKAEMLENGSGYIHAASQVFPIPSVIRLDSIIRRPRLQRRLTRLEVFNRDNYTCQYCGHRSKELTIDHVVPKRLGGTTSWENLVCCCRKCNTKKGDKTLQKVGFALKLPPRRPRYVPFISLTKYLEGARNHVWRDYLPIFDDLPEHQQAISEEGN